MRRLALLEFVLLFCSATSADAQGSGKWQTLNGKAPLVIARGGFSGIFPDSSLFAYQLAERVSLRNTIFWCDVQLTKDKAGICFPDLRLNNASNIEFVYSNKSNSYIVDGVSMQGWFSVDFTLKELRNVSLIQGIYSRSNRLDGNMSQIMTVQDLSEKFNQDGLWLNVEHNAFFTQHKLSMRDFVVSLFKSVPVGYISSPEVNFLENILAFKPSTTKLVFRFRERKETEPSTNQTYESLISNLTYIKTFASGILVPKTYIWPYEDMYLLPHTQIVSEAHEEGLEVFASDFANDYIFAYNFSYDPLFEYMDFIDNPDFSVDGVVSDFPITPSAAIACFSHVGPNLSRQANILVISSQGSSGDYPGCTDLAYNHATLDGADVLDCPVQMSKDGVPFCLGSINLIDGTTIGQEGLSNLEQVIPELGGPGIFTFSLNWSQIQNLKPAISMPYAKAYTLYRNPKSRNAGKLVSLSEFLAIANNSSVSGVLLCIENAAYLAKNRGLSVTDAVLDTLKKAGYSSQTSKKIMIQSTNSSVLMKFKEKSNFELVYCIDGIISSIDNNTIADIKTFANSAVVSKESVFTDDQAYLTGMTDIVAKLHAFKLKVYVRTFRNEFVAQAWDFMSDPYVEINTFVMLAEIDGVITEYPKTAANYKKKNRCLDMGSMGPAYMRPVPPRGLLQLMAPQDLPPVESPYPIQTEGNAAEPPLPVVSSPTSSPSGQPGPDRKKKVIIIVATVFGGVVLLGLFVMLCLRRRKKMENLKIQARLMPKARQTCAGKIKKEDIELPLFEFEAVATATNHLSDTNKLGEGGFGPVYKGTLEGGQEVAVKRLSRSSRQGLDEFKNEVLCIAKLQHRNLVKLLGCCIHGDEKMLIYEFMPNKSLDTFIFDENRKTLLDWPKHFDIINGIARGILYLHQDSRLRIIHRDLKASNILLDKDMNPKISDFGMARSFGGNDAEGNTSRVVGTYGYMSPEYAVDGLFSVKLDVFSFGVLVLEIVTGKRNRGFSHPDHNLNLLGHAWKLHKEGRSMELIDSPKWDSSCMSQVLRSIHIGLLCVQQNPEDRPTMASVVLMLGSDSTLPLPKQPGFFTERNVESESGDTTSGKTNTGSVNDCTITIMEPR